MVKEGGKKRERKRKCGRKGRRMSKRRKKIEEGRRGTKG